MSEWLEQKVQAEREWFRKEHEKQFGKSSKTDEELEKRLNVAIKQLKKLSKKKVCERKHFVPYIELPPPLEPVNWDAPLALKCVCPTGDCRCCCKGNTLLPKKRLPFLPRYDWWGLRVIFHNLRIMKYSPPAGVLAPDFAEAVKLESEFYNSPKGRAILTERGPEFCLSGCLKFFITNRKEEKNFTAAIEEMKESVIRGDTDQEDDNMTDEVTEEKDDGFSDDLWAQRICDQFYCTVGTQSFTNSDGEFIIGAYSHILFGSPDDNILCDIEGYELEISPYKDTPKDPRKIAVVKNTVDKLFHVTEIKQRFSKIKKDIVTSIFEIPVRRLDKESQYYCADITPDPDTVCESLADVRRKQRKKECARRLEKESLLEGDLHNDNTKSNDTLKDSGGDTDYTESQESLKNELSDEEQNESQISLKDKSHNESEISQATLIGSKETITGKSSETSDNHSSQSSTSKNSQSESNQELLKPVPCCKRRIRCLNSQESTIVSNTEVVQNRINEVIEQSKNDTNYSSDINVYKSSSSDVGSERYIVEDSSLTNSSSKSKKSASPESSNSTELKTESINKDSKTSRKSNISSRYLVKEDSKISAGSSKKDSKQCCKLRNRDNISVKSLSNDSKTSNRTIQNTSKTSWKSITSYLWRERVNCNSSTTSNISKETIKELNSNANSINRYEIAEEIKAVDLNEMKCDSNCNNLSNSSNLSLKYFGSKDYKNIEKLCESSVTDDIESNSVSETPNGSTSNSQTTAESIRNQYYRFYY